MFPNIKDSHTYANRNTLTKKQERCRLYCLSIFDEVLLPFDHKDGCRLEYTTIGLCYKIDEKQI